MPPAPAAAQAPLPASSADPHPEAIMWRHELPLVLLLLLTTSVTYLMPSVLRGEAVLRGADALLLHEYRIQYLQEAIFSETPHLPAWYTREALGTPFWSNLHSVPLNPVRWIAVLLVPSSHAFTVGVLLSAMLSAFFCYLFGRQIGLGPLAAFGAGWTFACSGYFAARVLAGHLPVLEAYPYLPLILLLIEQIRRSRRPGILALLLVVLSLSACAVALSGHPQLPLYILVTSALYALLTLPWRTGVVACTSMVLGVATGGVVLYPMLLLTLRSARFLDLETAGNSVAFSPDLLWRFLEPLFIGWRSYPLQGHPLPTGTVEIYYDSAVYSGSLAVLALPVLLLLWQRGIFRPRRSHAVLLVLAILSLLLSLPTTAEAGRTILRSPARILYVTLFALAIFFGAALQGLQALATKRSGRQIGILLAATLLLLQMLDLGWHDRKYITSYTHMEHPSDEQVFRFVGTERVAMSADIGIYPNRRLDDIGFFDAIALATTYQSLLALQEFPPHTNREVISPPQQMNARGLIYLGARLVVTDTARADLPIIGHGDGLYLHAVPNALPRIRFFGAERVSFLPEDAILARLRDQTVPLGATLMLPESARSEVEDMLSGIAAPTSSQPAGGVRFQRPRDDEIQCELQVAAPGFLVLVEAWDEGWLARVDGKPVPVLQADGFMIAIPIDTPGNHTVTLEFDTPGLATGIWISAAALALLTGLVLYNLHYCRSLDRCRPSEPSRQQEAASEETASQ